MSTQERYEQIPEWSLGDRLRKARTLTGMTVSDFAQAIGVSDRTINNAEGDKRAVRKITLNAWALATGVPVDWLETGTTAGPPTPGPGQSSEALDRLTERKLSRGRATHPRATRRYVPALAAA